MSKPSVELTLSDSSGSEMFHLEKLQILSSTRDSVVLFKASSGEVRFFAAYSMIGQIRDKLGRTVSVAINIDMDDSAIEVKALDAGGPQTLFYSFAPQD